MVGRRRRGLLLLRLGSDLASLAFERSFRAQMPNAIATTATAAVAHSHGLCAAEVPSGAFFGGRRLGGGPVGGSGRWIGGGHLATLPRGRDVEQPCAPAYPTGGAPHRDT